MTREYGQFCGLSHALDLLGSRWTLMIVRDLLIAPRRFTELEHGLPGIPTNILSARLRELEENGLVKRRLLPIPLNSVVYELTDYGRDLEEPLLRLGLWGARSLGAPKSTDFVSSTSLALGLRAMFHPDAAKGVHLVFAVPVRDTMLRGAVEDGSLTVPAGSDVTPDLTIRADPSVMLELFHHEENAGSAVQAKRIEIDGTIEDANRFFEIFNLVA